MSANSSKFQIPNSKMQKAAFLDRDGTICEDANYLSRPEDLKIFPFAAEAINFLRENGFLVILITNQSGIARGFFSENDLREIHEKLASELAEQNARLDAIYFCPHSIENNCCCRKPQIGMIEQAARDFSIDFTNSWLIGDKAIDVETGFNAGIKTALVLTGYGEKEVEISKEKADLISPNLLDAVKEIIKNL